MKITMTLVLFVFSVLGVVAQDYPASEANTQTNSTTLLLQGIVMQKATGGYLVVSIPAKDIKRLAELVETLSPHAALLTVIERIEKEAVKSAVKPESHTVPAGVCFLVTEDELPRHKILDRDVVLMGKYTYLNRQERQRTVLAYSSGQNRR